MERWNDTKLVDLGSSLLDMLKPECAPNSMLVENLCTSTPWCENWTQKEFWFKLICDSVSLSDCFCFPCPFVVVSVNFNGESWPGHRCVWLGYPGGDRLHPEEDGGPGWWNHRHCTTVAGPAWLIGGPGWWDMGLKKQAPIWTQYEPMKKHLYKHMCHFLENQQLNHVPYPKITGAFDHRSHSEVVRRPGVCQHLCQDGHEGYAPTMTWDFDPWKRPISSCWSHLFLDPHEDPQTYLHDACFFQILYSPGHRFHTFGRIPFFPHQQIVCSMYINVTINVNISFNRYKNVNINDKR